MNKEVSRRVGRYSAVITGTGSFVPDKILTNEDLSRMVDTSDEWITTRTGIKTRHITTDDETTADLATEAGRNALKAAGIAADKLDLIIVSTITPEMVFPSTACFVQSRLGADNATAFDLAGACSGFVYSIATAQNFLQTGAYEAVLVIGAETLTKITNWKDRTSCILFGDGAGAVVVQRSEEEDRGIIYSTMGSDGSKWETLNCQAYGSRYPVGSKLDDQNKIYMEIKGREVYQQAVRKIIESIDDCLDKCELKLEDVDMIISHQMNARIIESVTKRLGIDNEKVFINIDEYGNTSSASIPIAFDECIREGKIKKSDIVIFVAFGAGLTWGANVVKI